MKSIIRSLFILISLFFVSPLAAVGASGMYQWSVALKGYISTETGKAPTAYLWIPKECQQVKAVVFAQQNMTEKMIFKMPALQKWMQELGVGLIWAAPWLTQNWDPTTGCQQTFEEMIEGEYEWWKARYAETRGKQTRTIEVGTPQWSADSKALTITAPKGVRIDDDTEGCVTMISRATGQMEKVHPLKIGRQISSLNRQIVGLARDAAKLYVENKDERLSKLMPYKVDEQPVLTYVARQWGDAWTKPFKSW